MSRILLAENILGQSFGLPGLIALFVFLEEFKIPTVVKDQKSSFVGIFTVDLIHTGQPFAQTGSPADHLPELCFGTHLLEEHQVHTFGHVDTSVHHIHRNRNVRLFFGHLKSSMTSRARLSSQTTRSAKVPWYWG